MLTVGKEMHRLANPLWPNVVGRLGQSWHTT